MSKPPVVFGTIDSVYVRIVRLVLEEKGVSYDIEPVDVFDPAAITPEYLERHPFGRMPAFEHEGFRLYETSAITRYIDDSMTGPSLSPADARRRARMNQFISIADNYLYRPAVWDVFVERINKPERGEAADESTVRRGSDDAARALAAIADLMAEPWLTGDTLSLADLHLAPMLDYFLMTPEGTDVGARFPAILAWWERISQRPSLKTTRPT
jgi:glutathione S-transferase